LLSQRANTILLGSYDSPTEGFTIYIDVQSPTRLNEIEGLMRDLAAGKSRSFAFSELTDTHWIPPLREILLSISTAELLVTAERRKPELVCHWSGTAEDWLDSADKIREMACFGTPCHQYFEDSNVEDPTLKIAFLEKRAASLTRQLSKNRDFTH
jgi:hypothetical protein